MINAFRELLREEDGASLAEYAMLLGIITVAMIGVFSLFKDAIGGIFTRTTNTFNSASSA